MATLTSVEVRCCSELAGVFVLVTIGAVFKLHFENRVHAARDVALFASHFCVRALQRIGSRRMIRNRESRRLPALHRVATGALAAIRTFRELSLMRIGLVAVGAFREHNRLLEITAAVTLNAADRGVFSQQRKLGFRVVEFLVQPRRKLLPSTGVVAGLASLGKCSVVRIAMAIGTLPKRNARVAWLVVGTRRVAFFARNLHMRTGQWIARFRVIKLLWADRFPIGRVVALGAIDA